MFNNIIYFIIVLVLFFIHYPDDIAEVSTLHFFSMLVVTWLIFTGYCAWGFWDLKKRFVNQKVNRGNLSAQHQRLIVRLSILAIFLFALDVCFLNLKAWIQLIPGTESLSVLQGVIALALFFFYLSTIWFCAHPIYQVMVRQSITRRSYLISNLRFNLPFLFPWMILSLIYDLITLSPWMGENGFNLGILGNIFFFVTLIIIMMVYLPGMMRYCWGCKPLLITEKTDELKAFLQEKGFKYRELLRWPIFEGRMMTAGIMGIVSRYRYILITDSLMEILSIEELKAVLSHEMGHIRYHHLFFYVLFLMGFMVISFGFQELLPYLFYLHPFFAKLISVENAYSINLFYMIMSLPILLLFIIYFRYVMGFFMRNFERQADLYSVEIMGTPIPIIKSLEKIAYFSGKTRDIPSWHHFSIRERVACLSRTLEDPGLIKRHNRWIFALFLICMTGIVGLGYTLNFSPLKQHVIYSMATQVLTERLSADPDNIALSRDFAMICHEMGELEQATLIYENIIAIDPEHSMSLNNLAWILLTATDEKIRDEDRALGLSKRAVALERSPVYLDTLAEAYYQNGYTSDAIKTIKEAISVAKENPAYYEKQLERFIAEK